MEEEWHSLSARETAEKLNTDAENGLSGSEAKKRLQEFGYNRLAEKKKKPWLLVFLEQFNNFVVWILIAAAVISFIIWAFFGNQIENLIDAGLIMLIVVINAILGFVQEYRAEKAMEALKKMLAAKAIVVRNGKEEEVNASSLVPGDIVLLREGERIPADIRITESVNLRVDEASLTGESVPVPKHENAIEGKVALGDRKNMAFMNTIASYGRGTGIVVATGMKTEFGKIAGMLQGIEEEETPLMRKLDSLGAFLGKLVIVIAVAMFVLSILTTHFSPVELFLVSVSLAVAAIPEGLPAIVTITLAFGMNVMARNNAVVRKMSAVETLGSTSVICSDKTGTITKNEMTVTKAVLNEKEITVSGEGYKTEGKLLCNGMDAEKSKELDLLMKTCVLCNTANIGSGKKEEIIGDPTEIALLVLAAKAGYQKEALEKEAGFLRELPFDSERKRMSVVYEIGGRKLVFCKGSVESVLSACKYYSENGKTMALSGKMKEKFLAENDELAMDGLRILGFAFKELSKGEAEHELVFLGMCGMIDAPREEAKEAIRLCEKAGIEVKMVTGDHKLTAIAVAKQVGLMKQDSIAVTGEELDRMSERELEEKIGNIVVFARVSPSHKMRIIDALKKNGMVTAMTGDGVNDAPALKKADIGVAMGITGTDVSKEASEIVITDDNFATIVKAVEEGRKVYSNIKSFVKYLVSANTAEVLVVGSVVLLGPLGLPLPLSAVQILWLNLVTDGLPALALGSEKADRDIMAKKPREKSEKITDGIKGTMLAAGIIGAAITLTAFFYGLQAGDEKAKTMAFITLVFFELVWVFNCRSEDKDVFQMNPLGNKALAAAVLSSVALTLVVLYAPFLQDWFKVTPLSGIDWAIVLVLSASALFIPRIIKLFERKK